jgi:hypothetical protein
VAILRSSLEFILKRKRHGSLTPRLGNRLASRRLQPFRCYQSRASNYSRHTLSQADRRRRSAESINLIVANLPCFGSYCTLLHRLLGIEVFHFVCNASAHAAAGPGEQREEVAPVEDVGTSSPSALAVLRLTTISNLVGSIMGKSPTFSSLRMRPV